MTSPVERIEFIEIVGRVSRPEERRHDRSLPRHATRLFGRESEVAQLRVMLRDPHLRLITVTGPGGVGKTRLALEASQQLAADFPDGTVFVSLAPVRNPVHVIPTIARTLGLPASGHANLLDALSVSLHEQHLLLLLDNFEQVVEAAVDLAQLLAACPRLKLLVTSRTPLRIGDETVFLTTPLSLRLNPASPENEERNLPGAVQLFVERAHKFDPTFHLNDQNASDILEICIRLDGLPLAIELSAARIGTISPAELLRRLDPRLPMLGTGNRDAPGRQQTMRSTIAWSYELLGETDRQLFRWLSVFVGGFRLSAAESIVRSMQPPDIPLASDNSVVLDGISALLDSNLLHRLPGNNREYRYAMLEVVREFGLELLKNNDELLGAQSAHAAWCASIREWLDPNRFHSGELLIDHLWDIDAEHPNLRVALANCAESGDYQRLLEIAGALAVFWHHRGFLGEGRAWLELALDSAEEASTESRCWGLAGLGLVLWTQGDSAAAEPILHESLDLAIALDHIELQALSLHILALIDIELNNQMRARDRIEAALAHWQRLELPSDEGMALNILSMLPPRTGDPDRRMDDVFRALAIFESIGHTGGIAHAQHRIGRLLQEAGDERRAFGHHALAISTWLSIDERRTIFRVLVTVAEMAVAHDQPVPAALLVGAIDQRHQLWDSALGAPYKEIFERLCQTVEKSLGESVFQSKRRAGSAMTGAEIDALVASLGSKLFERSILSQRESEVLRRMAEGETDNEIADRLFLSPRTVHSHVSHILTKLDASTRREAVKRGHELGLLDLVATPHRIEREPSPPRLRLARGCA